MNLTSRAVNSKNSLWRNLQDAEQENLRGGVDRCLGCDWRDGGKLSPKGGKPRKPQLLDAFKYLSKEQLKQKQEEWNMTDADIYGL